MISGIAGEFRRGRLVRIEADGEGDREFLAGYLARDRGAGRLGELALVDDSSRVGAGRAARTSRRCSTRTPRRTSPSASDSVTRRGPGAPPVNRSGVHLDVMIGSPEMDVEAIDARGDNVTLIAGGTFASAIQ